MAANLITTGVPAIAWLERSACLPLRAMSMVLLTTLAVTVIAPATATAQQLQWRHRKSTDLPRYYHAMAYSPDEHVTIRFGGITSNALLLGDTCLLDEADWHCCAIAGPSPRAATAMAYDTDEDVAVLFGGAITNNSTVNGETWEWNGETWALTNRPPPEGKPSPSARFGHAMAYDVLSQRTILFGGYAAGLVLGDTWGWNANVGPWEVRTPTDGPSPSPRYTHSMSYDSVNNVIVLFGGDTGPHGVAHNDETWIWRWNAKQCVGVWTQLEVNKDHPSARFAHSMTYDASRGITVLYGGVTGGNIISGETWTLRWNGSGPGVWTRAMLCGPGSPSPRFYSSMAFDSDRSIHVLHGGINANVLSDDTWELGAPCPTDLNCDGVVNSVDFFEFLTCFFNPEVCTPGQADINRDGEVTSTDFFLFLAAFFSGC